MENEFKKFDSIKRLSREMVITEKLDGTNAQIKITETGELLIGSRKRWITPENDNYGFARWVMENESDIRTLGEGTHFGEWWGCGIQRRYDLKEKRFSLFNTGRWNGENKPSCCHIVPVLYTGPFSTIMVDEVLAKLYFSGSIASPGFMQPEGVVVFHSASYQLFKKTLDNNDSHKFMSEEKVQKIGRNRQLKSWKGKENESSY